MAAQDGLSEAADRFDCETGGPSGGGRRMAVRARVAVESGLARLVVE